MQHVEIANSRQPGAPEVNLPPTASVPGSVRYRYKAWQNSPSLAIQDEASVSDCCRVRNLAPSSYESGDCCGLMGSSPKPCPAPNAGPVGSQQTQKLPLFPFLVTPARGPALEAGQSACSEQAEKEPRSWPVGPETLVQVRFGSVGLSRGCARSRGFPR